MATKKKGAAKKGAAKKAKPATTAKRAAKRTSATPPVVTDGTGTEQSLNRPPMIGLQAPPSPAPTGTQDNT